MTCLALLAVVCMLVIGMFVAKAIIGAQMNAGRVQAPPPQPSGSPAPARPKR